MSKLFGTSLMPPEKNKRKRTEYVRNDEPTEYYVRDDEPIWQDDKDDDVKIGQRISKVREKIRSTLTPLVTERHKDAELDYLINTTQALITSNNEIWDRCKANLGNQGRRWNQLNEPVLCYYRRGFNEVTVSHKRNQCGALELDILALYKQQDKTFTAPCLPHPLRTVVIPVLCNNGMLNYHQYLKRSLLLEESILLLFLAILKDHLEEFQVFLGDIESWLMISARSAIYIQKTFNVKLPGNHTINTYYLLRTIQCPEAHTLSFDVTCRNGQKRLTIFIYFVTHPALGDE